MELRDYVRILHKNWILILILLLLGLTGGAGYAALQAPKYVASTQLYVSVRTELNGRDAYDLIRGALDGEGSFGGHGTVAGGSIPLPDTDARTLKRLERRLEKNILRTMGVQGVSVGSLGG